MINREILIHCESDDSKEIIFAKEISGLPLFDVNFETHINNESMISIDFSENNVAAENIQCGKFYIIEAKINELIVSMAGIYFKKCFQSKSNGKKVLFGFCSFFQICCYFID